jgi:hypothetical protein
MIITSHDGDKSHRPAPREKLLANPQRQLYYAADKSFRKTTSSPPGKESDSLRSTIRTPL